MPINLEVKARITEIERAMAVSNSLKLKYSGIIHQVDTYFKSPNDRLKLRETDDGSGELIYYKRQENSNERESKFEIYSTQNPSVLKEILVNVYGIQAIVSKKRHLYFLDDTRIHIDEVKDLGTSLEIEIPFNSIRGIEHEKLQFLIKEFSLKESDFIKCSYSDMIIRSQRTD